MDGISRSRGWDKEIPHSVLPIEQLVLGDMWARILYPILTHIMDSFSCSPLNTTFLFTNRLTEVPEYAEI